MSAAIYEEDPTRYIAEFEAYLQGWEGSDEERDLASWVTFAAVGEDDPNIFRFVALGYITATWESWANDLGDRRLGLFENMRRKSERDCSERGIPEELYDLIYGTNVISVQIADFARPGDESLADRLDLIFEQVVLRNTEFESTPSEETLLGLARSTTAASASTSSFSGGRRSTNARFHIRSAGATSASRRFTTIGLLGSSCR